MFHTQQDVHPNHIFSPVVTAPSVSADYKPRVDWSKFHSVVPLESDELKSPHLEHVGKSWGTLSGQLWCKLLCRWHDTDSVLCVHIPAKSERWGNAALLCLTVVNPMHISCA